MPRVLRIINRFNIGGPSYNVAYLTKYLSPEFETLLIGGNKEPGEESSLYVFEEMGLKPLLVEEMNRSVNFFQDVKAYRRIKKIIREFRPDIVHTHAAKAGALGRMAAYACGVPVIVHTFHGHVFHSYFGKFRTALFKQAERFLAKKTSAIIAISEKQKEELVAEHRIAPAEKIQVIPLGFDLHKFTTGQETKRQQFRTEYGVADDEICILIVGRLVPVKNHALFLRAVASLQKQTSRRIRAFIVGDGELREELIHLAAQLKLSTAYWPTGKKNANVTFTSWIQDVSYPLAGSDIVCLTSYNEGTPVSLIEAQAAGKPIISTRTGGIENIVSPGAAFLADIKDEKLFTEKLLQLCENDVLRSKTGDAGKDFVLERFHYTRLVNDVRELYLRLLTQTDKFSIFTGY